MWAITNLTRDSTCQWSGCIHVTEEHVESIDHKFTHALRCTVLRDITKLRLNLRNDWTHK